MEAMSRAKRIAKRNRNVPFVKTELENYQAVEEGRSY